MHCRFRHHSLESVISISGYQFHFSNRVEDVYVNNKPDNGDVAEICFNDLLEMSED